jgi:hypothetical protein
LRPGRTLAPPPRLWSGAPPPARGPPPARWGSPPAGGRDEHPSPGPVRVRQGGLAEAGALLVREKAPVGQAHRCHPHPLPGREAFRGAEGARSAGRGEAVIEIRPVDPCQELERALTGLGGGTPGRSSASQRGGDLFQGPLRARAGRQGHGGVRVAAIGPGTAAALRRWGIVPDMMAKKYYPGN